jgi:tetratricopeptide (TPR) repeat protein
MSDNPHYIKGLNKLNENRFEEAIELFTKAIEEDPSNPFFYNERAVCYLNIRKLDLSMFDMNKSIELDANYAYFYSSRGFLKTKMKDLEGAVADYERSLQLDPQNEITYNNLGLALESIGKMKQAQRMFKEGNKILGYDPNKRKLSDDGKMMEDAKGEVPPAQEEAQDKIADNNETPSKKPNTYKTKKSRVAKDVFTKKSAFREFLGFIGNGFKLKDNDKS